MSGVAASSFQQKQVSDKAYQVIRNFIYTEAGIDLGPSKHMLVLLFFATLRLETIPFLGLAAGLCHAEIEIMVSIST